MFYYLLTLDIIFYKKIKISNLIFTKFNILLPNLKKLKIYII